LDEKKLNAFVLKKYIVSINKKNMEYWVFDYYADIENDWIIISYDELSY
jgi:hypothetical protein